MNALYVLSLGIFLALILSASCMILFSHPTDDYNISTTTIEQNIPNVAGLTQNATTPKTTVDEIDGTVSSFNVTGEAVIQRYIYNHTADVCWRFTREFRKYNPEWSDLTLGIGDAFGKCPHSVAYLRRNATSAYVHDAWGGDTFILEFDKNGTPIMWNRIENGTKIFDTRNADWLKQYDHFNFAPNERQTTIRAIRQDNRQQFIEGEI